ncbi:MAG: hypothetical protein LQ343_003769 [Gyalolechia ehrenbergii]|nr:MAG: hypothetical protein LQ343_003769 [Gyalolechia ehrenbergii]
MAASAPVSPTTESFRICAGACVAWFEDVFSNDQLRQSSAPKAYHPQTLIWLPDAPTSGGGSVCTRAYHMVESKEADVLLGQTSPEADRVSHSSGDFFLPKDFDTSPYKSKFSQAFDPFGSTGQDRGPGSYTGGHLVLPELSIRIDQQPDDVTLMHARVLIHMITEIYENRMCNEPYSKERITRPLTPPPKLRLVCPFNDCSKIKQSESTFLKHLRGPANKDDNVRAKANDSKI